jgi:hypothetical protein
MTTPVAIAHISAMRGNNDLYVDVNVSTPLLTAGHTVEWHTRAD